MALDNAQMAHFAAKTAKFVVIFVTFCTLFTDSKGDSGFARICLTSFCSSGFFHGLAVASTLLHDRDFRFYKQIDGLRE
jgi:hypothetical protein